MGHSDTVEAVKTVNSLKVLSGNGKDYPIDLTIGDGKIVMAVPGARPEAQGDSGGVAHGLSIPGAVPRCVQRRPVITQSG